MKPVTLRNDRSLDETCSGQSCAYLHLHRKIVSGRRKVKRAALSIYDAAGSLKEMPNRGGVGRKPGTREITVGRLPFVIVYRVQKEAVQILRILHDSQQWP